MNKIILYWIISLLVLIDYGHTHDNPWYVGIEGGYSLLGTEKSVGDILNSNIRFKNGAVFGGIIGYDYGQYRVEAEIGKHLHNVNSMFISDDGGLGLGSLGNQSLVSGKSNHTRYMMNIVFDFQKFPFGKTIEPFIGTGLGLSNIKWNNISTINATLTNDAENSFSYQVFSGIRYLLSQNLEMSIKYRYFRSIDVDLADRLTNPFDISYDTHDFMIGLTYHFGQGSGRSTTNIPPTVIAERPIQADKPTVINKIEPPAITNPVVIDNGPYKIYYEWDSSEIDEAGKKIIQTAASEAKRGNFVVIELDGHADRSGSEEYNEALSLERAEKVKTALIFEKIENSMISVEAHGESDPEIETPDGVRERQNRRVVIFIK